MWYGIKAAFCFAALPFLRKRRERIMSGNGWIWYPGDFELYHGMLQNFQREERSYGWPAYWKMDDWRKNVRFCNSYQLEEADRIRVTAMGQGYAAVNGRKFPFGQWIDCREEPVP